MTGKFLDRRRCWANSKRAGAFLIKAVVDWKAGTCGIPGGRSAPQKPSPGTEPPRNSGVGRAFTLVELLAVLAVLALGVGVASSLLSNRWRASGRFTLDCQRLELLLREIQQGAICRGQHRYMVFWDPEETAEGGEPGGHSKSPPRTRPLEAPGLRVAAYTRGDGALGFETRQPRESWREQTLRPRALQLLGSIQRFETLRLVASLPPPSVGPMRREPISRFQRLGHPSGLSALTLPVPFKSGAGELRRILHFAPDGRCQIVHQTTAANLVRGVELGLRPVWIPPPEKPLSQLPESPNSEAPGETEESGESGAAWKSSGEKTSTEVAPSGGEETLHAAIQISGINGRIRLYLP